LLSPLFFIVCYNAVWTEFKSTILSIVFVFGLALLLAFNPSTRSTGIGLFLGSAILTLLFLLIIQSFCGGWHD